MKSLNSSLGRLQFLGWLWGTFFLFSCSFGSRSYTYPTSQDTEIERICSIAVNEWNRKQFEVRQNRVIAEHPEYQKAFENALITTLYEGLYYCGQAEIKRFPCAVGAIRRVDGGRCLYD